jgi:hypothetical protein
MAPNGCRLSLRDNWLPRKYRLPIEKFYGTNMPLETVLAKLDTVPCTTDGDNDKLAHLPGGRRSAILGMWARRIVKSFPSASLA